MALKIVAEVTGDGLDEVINRFNSLGGSMAIEIVLKIGSDELIEAVDRFEAIHGKIYKVIPNFVLALVNFTHEALGG